MKQFGLIGYPLSHSFSKEYFSEKFNKEQLTDCEYNLYPLKHIQAFEELCQQQSDLVGLNVTLPYKEQVIAYLDLLDEEASAIGAVNTIKFVNGKKIGYNSDCFGFEQSLFPLLQSNHTAALILGTGGASKAILYVLKRLGISWKFVSRSKTSTSIGYEELNAAVMQQFTLIINTTPMGMYPDINTLPPIPFNYVNERHLLYDLVYNPEETLFLKKGKKQGAQTKNGLEMLFLQAERSWQIWNS